MFVLMLPHAPMSSTESSAGWMKSPWSETKATPPAKSATIRW